MTMTSRGEQIVGAVFWGMFIGGLGLIGLVIVILIVFGILSACLKCCGCRKGRPPPVGALDVRV